METLPNKFVGHGDKYLPLVQILLKSYYFPYFSYCVNATSAIYGLLDVQLFIRLANLPPSAAFLLGSVQNDKYVGRTLFGMTCVGRTCLE